MRYHVIYGPGLRDDLRDHVVYLRRQRVSQAVIDRWFNGLFESLDSLAEWPRRYPVAEQETAETGRETRKMNFKDYLVLYQIDEERKQVNLVAYDHGAGRA